MVVRTEGSLSPYLAGFVTSPLGAHPARSGAATVEPVAPDAGRHMRALRFSTISPGDRLKTVEHSPEARSSRCAHRE